MAKKKKHEKEQNLERWLISYADLISLLMFFFFVMFSASQIQKEKLLAISESLRRALTNEAVMGSAVGANILSQPTTSSKTTAVAEALKEEIRAFGIDKGVSFSTDERGVIITILDSIFFDAGGFDMKARVRPLLKKIGYFIKETNTKAVVEGHTDNTEIKSLRFILIGSYLH